ncbi:MAG TPA: rRNA maturation RNase YbeY [Pyrinomonadaceae bacterium]
MIEIVNRQRKVPIDIDHWRDFTTKAMQTIPTGVTSVTIVFVSDRLMSELNLHWRDKSGTTDVLSFPAEQAEFEMAGGPTLGDIVISVERAVKQARENSWSVENEIAQLILHGLLHLCGYDHETDNGEMNRLEIKLRKRLEI